MAVSSDDWPRFSLLTGAGRVYAEAEVPQIERALLNRLANDFTCESWVQIRPLKGRGNNTASVDHDSCWLIHTSTWAFGFSSNLQVVVRHNGKWLTSASPGSSQRPLLRARKWHHVAVAYISQPQVWTVVIDGEPVVLAEIIPQLDRPVPPISSDVGFRIGWTPLVGSSCQLMIHELRVWETHVCGAIVKSWMNRPVSEEHPFARHLVAHWSFSSGSNTRSELDLCGNDAHLLLFQKNTTADTHWVRHTPQQYPPAVCSKIARLSTWQDPVTNSGKCHFVLEIKMDCHQHEQPRMGEVVIVLVVNFCHFRSPNLTTQGKGAGVIGSLQEFVHKLPCGFTVAIYDMTSPSLNGEGHLVLAPTCMDDEGKIHACKALERIYIKTLLPVSKLPNAVTHCVHNVTSLLPAADRRRSITALIVNEDMPSSHSSIEMANAAERLQGERLTVELHTLHVGASTPNDARTAPSSLSIDYVACDHDFEWVLSVVLCRIQQIVATAGELILLPVGGASFRLTSGSQPPFQRYVEQNYRTERLVIPIGCCASGERVVLNGIAAYAATTDAEESRRPVVAAVFTYCSPDGRRHVAHSHIRFGNDLTNYIHMERAERNKQLRFSEDERLLFEQRREMMKEKASFVATLISQEVAEAENAFKKVNIMKEELWAKRKWIVDRAMRLFEEQELQVLGEEATCARVLFVERMAELQASSALNSRESGSRGASRSHSKTRESIVHHRGGATPPIRQSPRTEGQSDDSDEQRLLKISVKLSVLAKALEEHQAKMEDLFVSVRLAETKGFVIMNDTRRRWIVRFQDMAKVKQDLFTWTLAKESIEQTQAFCEEREVTRQSVETENQFVNASIARYEKELPKRRKRVALCVKEISGSVLDEFDASEQVETAKRNLSKCRLMKTMALTHEMHASCVYVCFPLELSQLEVTTKSHSIGGFVNVVQGLCYGLRNFCDHETEEPVCRRLSLGESFLWWGLEQQTFPQDPQAASANLEERHLVQMTCWASVVVTYNSLFSSALAMDDLKGSLAAARNRNAPVFHIQLERPYQGLEEFRQLWVGRCDVAVSQSVEREFLVWKQNYAAFQSLLASIVTVETPTSPLPDAILCEHRPISRLSDLVSSFFPCLDCTWPLVGSSRVSHHEDVDQLRSRFSHPWFLQLVGQISTWLDGGTSLSLQMAPRSYHVDPNVFCPHSRRWETYQEGLVANASHQWQDACQRRSKEVQRKIAKMDEVYEDETFDLVALQFKFTKRRETTLGGMTEQLNMLVDERALLQTWHDRLKYDDTKSETGLLSREREQMVAEELWQHLHHADAAMAAMEALDELSDAPPKHELAQAKMAFENALKQSSRAILELGRTHLEDYFCGMLRRFKIAQYVGQIKIATMKCDEQQVQIACMIDVFDRAALVLGDMQKQREQLLLDDASAFFHASFLQTRCPPSKTTQEIDSDQLRKLAGDIDFHTALHAAAMTHAFESQLASSTAIEYRDKLAAATTLFLHAYTPSMMTESEHSTAERSVSNLKDFCQVHADGHAKTWASLLEMRELVDKEVLHDRERQRVVGQWKLRFMGALIDHHIKRWWTSSFVLMTHTRGRLAITASAKDEQLTRRRESESAFQSAVTERENLSHRLGLLQRRLAKTQARHNFQLQLLQIARRCYETATNVMNDKLQKYKTDAIYKNWFRVGDYHVGLVGELYDWRSQCSKEVEVIMEEITDCQRGLARCSDQILSTRLRWLKESISDGLVCAQAERLQAQAHGTLELLLTLEKQRVFHQLRVLDPRNAWLTTAVLTSWWEDYERSKHLKQQIGTVGGVDDLLVQLSIARLDVIKQEKWGKMLQQKIDAYDRILQQQTEMRQIINGEVATYRSLGDRLASRVQFLRDKYKASGDSQFLVTSNNEADHDANGSHPVSSINRVEATHAVRVCREQVKDMIASAQQEYLTAEATTCQLAWRAQQHLTFAYRTQDVKDAITKQLLLVQEYLALLKHKDHELYLQGNQTPDQANSGSCSDGVGSSPWRTDAMGMRVEVALAVFEYFTRTQWFRACLNETTALGERVKSLRAVLTSLQEIKKSPRGPENKQESSGQGDGESQNEGGRDRDQSADEDQLTIVADELRAAELALLLNRYESRLAEKTSEGLKTEIDGLITNTYRNGDIELVMPMEAFQSRLFSIELCGTARDGMMAQLRQLATTFDARDIAGNLSEAIYGASLDKNELTQIFLLQSKAHVEDQWSVVYVVLFFARLFRRAALQKEAKKRREQGAVLTQNRLVAMQDRAALADRVLSLADLVHQPPQSRQLHLHQSVGGESSNLVECVGLYMQETGDISSLSRVALGIQMNQSLHRLLLVTEMPERTSAFCDLADELEERRALVEHRPPKPTRMEVVYKDKHAIKIQWKPILKDHDLIYVAEISERQVHPPTTDQLSSHKRFWNQFLTTDKTSHTFYSLHPAHAYWVRVRSGFTRTKLGEPCLPLLVTTLD